MRKIKVAQVLTKGADSGTEVVVRNYCQAIGDEIDWVVLIENECKVINQSIVSSFRGKLYTIPAYKNFFSYEKKVLDIFKQEKVDIVHANLSTVSFAPLLAAKRAGVPVRIAHSHTTTSPGEGIKNIEKKLFRSLTMRYCNDYFCCSPEAGRFQFGKWVDAKDMFILPNAFKVENFAFSMEARKKIRAEYKLNKEIVIGFVGRLERQKNPLFVIDVLSKLKDLGIVLLVVGSGTMEQTMKEYAIAKGVKTIFCGTTSYIAEYYSAMDMLIAPSLFEGFGNVVVEAQANGLPVFFSMNFPESASVVPYLCHIQKSFDADLWATAIYSNLNGSIQNVKREINLDYFKSFNIDVTKRELVNRYRQDLEKVSKRI